jgi:hypothetical protein
MVRSFVAASPVEMRRHDVRRAIWNLFLAVATWSLSQSALQIIANIILN